MSGNEWRPNPVETAPKDDDILLGCFGEHSYGTQFVAFFDDEPVGGIDYVWQTADGISYHRDLPTHWMPLPDPPT